VVTLRQKSVIWVATVELTGRIAVNANCC